MQLCKGDFSWVAALEVVLMTSTIAVALVLIGQQSGIKSLEVYSPGKDSPGVAYTVTVEGFGDLSDADVAAARGLIYQMRRAGGPGTPMGGFILGGGSLVETDRKGRYLSFEQKSGPKALLQTGQVMDTGMGIQKLRRVYILGNSKVDLWFDEDADQRYISHGIEVITQYLEKTHHGGHDISLDAKMTRTVSFRIVHLVVHGSE